ncbi:MAG: hypothetical protein R2795_10525 [Saprospiraceae bacterium]
MPVITNTFGETGRTGAMLPVQGSAMAGVLDGWSVTVTDGAGCSIVDSVLFRPPIALIPSKSSPRPFLPAMPLDGSITLVPLNGLPPFSWIWEDENGQTDTGSSTQDTLHILDLPQSTYRITLTDNSAEGCQVILRNIRIQGRNFQLGETTVNNPSCAGLQDGRNLLRCTRQRCHQLYLEPRG